MSKFADCTVYCDIDVDDFPSPSIITGVEKRPDIVINKDRSLIIWELTEGFETNSEKTVLGKTRELKYGSSGHNQQKCEEHESSISRKGFK